MFAAVDVGRLSAARPAQATNSAKLTLGCAGGKSDNTVTGGTEDWPHYSVDAGGSRYSRAGLITRENIKRLEVAWIAPTGDFSEERFDSTAARTSSSYVDSSARRPDRRRSCDGCDIRFETTPLMRDGTLYLATPRNSVIALDAISGATRWTFNARVDISRRYAEGFTSRGAASTHAASTHG